MVKLALIGEYRADSPTHRATISAIEHISKRLRSNVEADWISSTDIQLPLFDEYAGVWITPGSPHKQIENTLSAIRYAREHRIPCFGTCGGFQLLVLEYARNVLSYWDAKLRLAWSLYHLSKIRC